MCYYLAGYYLMRFNPTLPDSYNSIDHYCGYINQTYPGAWGLSWGFKSLEEIPEELYLTTEELKKIHQWCDNKFNNNLFLWPDVFADKNTAIEFKKTFLKKSQIDKIYLVSIYSKDIYTKEIIEYEKSINSKANFGEPGIQQLLKKKIIETAEGEFIGFDMAGIQYGSSYHSFFSCYNLEQQYKDKFGTLFNEYRLISNEDDIEKIVNYTNNTFWGESDLWLPFKIKIHNQ